jgi:two-component system sensor histidine kinase CpxA
MRSLFLKIFLSFLGTAVVIAIALALPVMVMMFVFPPIAGGMKIAVLALPIITFGITVLVCFLITRHITSPLFALRRTADGIAGGNLAVRVPQRIYNRRDEIGQLGRDFDRMAERLESLVDGHKRLLGDVSHELRSPLSRMLVAMGLARKSTVEDMPEHFDRIALEANRLDTLIGQLLTLSRIESRSHAEASSLDLTNLVHEVVSDADFEARAQSKRAVVTVSDECAIFGSEELLRSAIENVIRNAVRFTPTATSVDVSIRRERQSAVIRVRDHGPGVPESMLSEIFLPFRRVPAPAGTTNEGSGLGLAIAQRAVAMNGGKIRARNASDGGLIVDIELSVTG